MALLSISRLVRGLLTDAAAHVSYSARIDVTTGRKLAPTYDTPTVMCHHRSSGPHSGPRHQSLEAEGEADADECVKASSPDAVGKCQACSADVCSWLSGWLPTSCDNVSRQATETHAWAGDMCVHAE